MPGERSGVAPALPPDPAILVHGERSGVAPALPTDPAVGFGIMGDHLRGCGGAAPCHFLMFPLQNILKLS